MMWYLWKVNEEDVGRLVRATGPVNNFSEGYPHNLLRNTLRQFRHTLSMSEIR